MVRRTKLDEETIQLTYELLTEGHYNEDVAEAINVSEKTFYNWHNWGEDISNQLENEEIAEEELTEHQRLFLQFFLTVKKAATEAKMQALKNIRKAGKKNWQAEAWFLERKYRNQFGRVTVIEDNSQQETQESKQSKLEQMIAGVRAVAESEDE